MGFISSNLNTMREYVRSLKEFIEESDETLQTLRTRLDGQIEPMLAGLDQVREKLDLDYVLGDIDNLIKESLEGSQRVRRIVQDLKTFSRADDGDMQLVDVNSVLDSALNIVWNQLKYTCTISKDYGRVPEIRCNPNQIGQVFVNLLANAGQAIARQKQGEIKIRTYADDGAIFVEVGDNGEGIPAQNLVKIFDPFFTTKPVGQGTGLGLSISYSIIQKHGGQINVDSEVDIGTTFTIKLPTSITM
ncbi:MAG: ATP-binding protein [Chloroflexi bacterium]|nr:ATP-binding protein [Chloroflexota bacterium]